MQDQEALTEGYRPTSFERDLQDLLGGASQAAQAHAGARFALAERGNVIEQELSGEVVQRTVEEITRWNGDEGRIRGVYAAALQVLKDQGKPASFIEDFLVHVGTKVAAKQAAMPANGSNPGIVQDIHFVSHETGGQLRRIDFSKN